MGNTQVSPISNHPSRPFAPFKRSCLTQTILATTVRDSNRRKVSILEKLILLQDWQRVLCRVELYPNELRKYVKFQVNAEHTLKVLPLHLICALDPPLAVVKLFLHHYVDAASLPLRPLKKKTKKKKSENRLQRRYQEWRRQRKGAFPVVVSYEDAQQCLLSQSTAPSSPNDNGSSSVYMTAAENQSEEGDDDEDSSHDSSLSSRNSSVDKNAILQLSPSGGLYPMPLQTEETAGEEEESDVFRVQWDLQPLFANVMEHGGLLPLHLACFYSAHASVLQALADAYPLAVLSDILGMLPIHWVAAGWNLPPLMPKPASTGPFVPPSSLPQPPSPHPMVQGPLPVLKVLQAAVPDTVRVRSGNHGLTPEDYIEECMEESNYKQECLRVVQFDKHNSSDDDPIFFSDNHSESYEQEHGDDDDKDDKDNLSPKSTSCMSHLFTERDWVGMLTAVEDDPTIASQWIYGLDDDDKEPAVVWKRLPIHLACVYGAPVGIVTLLLQSYPEGGTAVDPHHLSTPLHLACRARCSLAVIRLLVAKCSDSTEKTNKQGQLPLHVAVGAMSTYPVIELLVDACPASVLCMDKNGKTPMDYAKTVYGAKSSALVLELLTAVENILKKESFS